MYQHPVSNMRKQVNRTVFFIPLKGVSSVQSDNILDTLLFYIWYDNENIRWEINTWIIDASFKFYLWHTNILFSSKSPTATCIRWFSICFNKIHAFCTCTINSKLIFYIGAWLCKKFQKFAVLSQPVLVTNFLLLRNEECVEFFNWFHYCNKNTTCTRHTPIWIFLIVSQFKRMKSINYICFSRKTPYKYTYMES